MPPITSLKQLSSYVIPPQKTPAKIPFGNPPKLPTFAEAKVVIYGVPFDGTATFGKGSERGPEAMRHVSARQIWTYVVDEGMDIYEKVPVFDLGNFKIKRTVTAKDCKILQSESASEKERKKVVSKVAEVMKQFDVLADITKFIHQQGKIPILIGGEHTLSYWPLAALAEENPVVIHFDAHRDAKKEYMGMELCHTTPFYHFLQKNKEIDFVQIGIRQADRDEEEFAQEAGITTFYPQDVKQDLESVESWMQEKTKNRNVYITFDIDALDICYTPCTGTPEPFGLTPEEVLRILKSIDSSATLIGMDIMEVAVKNNDFREAAIATQMLLRILPREYVKK